MPPPRTPLVIWGTRRSRPCRMGNSSTGFCLPAQSSCTSGSADSHWNKANWMARRLLNLLTAGSLLLCVAVAVLWVRSYQVADYVMVSVGIDGSHVSVARGNCRIVWSGGFRGPLGERV